MMELLKQWVYSPVNVGKQVASIYAWSKWYLDTIDVSNVKKFESDLYNALDEEKTILESITKEKAISEDTEKKLKTLVEKTVEIYK